MIKETISYHEKLARDRALFYAVTGKTYIEKFNEWRDRYASRPRKKLWNEWFQDRLKFIRRIAL